MFFKVSSLVLCHIEALTLSAILVCRKGRHPGQPKWPPYLLKWPGQPGWRLAKMHMGIGFLHGEQESCPEHRIHAQGKGFVPGAQDSSPGDRLIAWGARFVAKAQDPCLGRRVRTQGKGF